MNAADVTYRGTSPTGQADVPVFTVHGGPGRLSIDTVRELWAFREVLWAFAVRQLKVRYKQAVIGLGWAILRPVASAVIFAVFIGRFAHVGSEGVSYLVFALAGMVIWSFFASAVGVAMESLVNDAGLLRKVYFPREVTPLAAVASALVDLLPALGILLIFTSAYGIRPTVTWLALPVPVLIVVVSATAFGLGLSALNVYYRDVRYVLPFMLQLGLFASPVIFSLDQVPGAWRTVYAIGNPIAGAIDCLRRTTLHHQWPNPLVAAGSFGTSAVLALLAYALFKRLERKFADLV